MPDMETKKPAIAPQAQVPKSRASKATEDNEHSVDAVAPWIAEINFEQHVVGSHTEQRIAAPWNLSASEARVEFVVQGESFRLASTAFMPLVPSAKLSSEALAAHLANSPLVVFAPTTTGNHTGRILAVVAFQDGRVETRAVGLRGRGRNVDEMPSAEVTAADRRERAARAKSVEVGAKHEADLMKKYGKGPLRSEPLDHQAKLATAAVGELNNMRRNGLDGTAKRLENFEPTMASPSGEVMWALLEVGLNMATAGIAGHFAKNVLPMLAQPLAVLREEKYEIAAFTADFFKEGIKQAGKKALSAAAKAQPRKEAVTREMLLNFFDDARHALAQTSADTEVLVIERSHALASQLAYEEAHPDQPAVAAQLMSAVARQFSRTAEIATAEQEHALMQQWISTVAQTSLGTTKAKGLDVDGKSIETKVTNMKNLHKIQSVSEPTAGVLDVRVNLEGPSPTIVSKRLFGISFHAFPKLAEMRLRELKIPMRFLMGAQSLRPVVVTRDEAGVLRVSETGGPSLERIAKANPAFSSATVTEGDAIEGAGYMLAQLLDEPLGEDVQHNSVEKK